MTQPRLHLSRKTLCVGHEIATKDAVGDQPSPTEAEMTVAGYSFCFPCGNAAVNAIVESGFPIEAVLRMFRDGVIEVAP